MLIFLSAIEGDDSRSRFTAIYNQYKNLMFHAANDILHNEQDAEDITHDAFLVVLDNIDRLWELKGPRIKAFLISIVEHKAIDLWRKRRRLPETLPFEEQVYLPSPQDEPLGLSDAIAGLPADYRALLMLKFHLGLTTREIAHMLGKKEGTVTRSLTRAKDRLALELEKIRKEEDNK